MSLHLAACGLLLRVLAQSMDLEACDLLAQLVLSLGEVVLQLLTFWLVTVSASRGTYQLIDNHPQQFIMLYLIVIFNCGFKREMVVKIAIRIRKYPSRSMLINV